MEAGQVSDEPQHEPESSTPEYDLDSEAIIKCAIVKTSLTLFHVEQEKTGDQLDFLGSTIFQFQSNMYV